KFLAIPDQDLVVHVQLFGERENPNLQQAFSMDGLKDDNFALLRACSPVWEKLSPHTLIFIMNLPPNRWRLSGLSGLLRLRHLFVVRVLSIRLGQAVFERARL